MSMNFAQVSRFSLNVQNSKHAMPTKKALFHILLH